MMSTWEAGGFGVAWEWRVMFRLLGWCVSHLMVSDILQDVQDLVCRVVNRKQETGWWEAYILLTFFRMPPGDGVQLLMRVLRTPFQSGSSKCTFSANK